MPPAQKASEAQFTFEISGTELGVVDFTAREEISSPYEVALTLASEDDINFDDVIGKEALFTILGEEVDRYFHGIINQFMQTGSSGRFSLYQATMVPSLWLLCLEQDCRIFQNKNVQDIVKQILQDGGITSDRFEFRLQNQPPAREFCVQYRETDLNFVSRLLEEEGIFYFFEHKKDKHLLVFGDSTVNYQPIQGEAKVVVRPPTALVPEEEFVHNFVFSRQIQSGKVTLRDFNFEKPSLDLTAQHQANSNQKLEVYDYPGEYLDQGRGKKLAEMHLQEAVMFKDKAEGQSVCPRFIPGFTFKLSDHERQNLNQEYLLVEVLHSGSHPQVLGERAGMGGSSYSNQFLGIPSSVTMKPERNTPKPTVEGVQTAIVVGPKGEEIYTEEHGRVKVQFHWDREGKRDENSSCWIRVSQAWAGPGWGAVYIPRIGQEVIVDFIEGDPDRPIITGRVYHGTNKPPYSLPEEKTKSTIKSDSSLGGGGSNEIRFEDKKGEEEIYLHGQKDWNIVIENDMTESIGSNMVTNVGSSKTETISVNSAESIGVAKELSIGGAYQVTVGAAMNATVGGAKMEEVGGYKAEAIGGKRTLNVGSDSTESVGGNKSINIRKDLSEDVGGKYNETVKKEYFLKSEKVMIEAEDEIYFKTGKSTIIMKRNGDIEIKGKNINQKASSKINIKASSDITIKGSKIKEN